MECLCTMPGMVIEMENVHGFLICRCDDGKDYVITSDGQYRDITGSIELFRSMV